MQPAEFNVGSNPMATGSNICFAHLLLICTEKLLKPSQFSTVSAQVQLCLLVCRRPDVPGSESAVGATAGFLQLVRDVT